MLRLSLGLAVVLFGWTTGAGQAADALGPEKLFTLRATKGKISNLAVTPDGKRLAASSGGSELRVWDLESHKQIADLSNIVTCSGEVSIDPSGAYVAAVTSGNDGHGVKEQFRLAVLDVSNQRLIKAFHLPTKTWVFAPSSKALWVLADGHLVEYPLSGAPPFRVRQLIKIAADEPELGVVSKTAKKPEFKKLIHAMHFSDDGSRAAYVWQYEGGHDVRLDVVKTSDGRTVLSRQVATDTNQAFRSRVRLSNPSGKWVLFEMPFGKEDKFIEVDGDRVFSESQLTFRINSAVKDQRGITYNAKIPWRLNGVLEQANLVRFTPELNGQGKAVLQDISLGSRFEPSRAIPWHLPSAFPTFTPDARFWFTTDNGDEWGSNEVTVYRYARPESKPK